MPGILKALVDLGWPLGWSLADAHTWPLPESGGEGDRWVLASVGRLQFHGWSYWCQAGNSAG